MAALESIWKDKKKSFLNTTDKLDVKSCIKE